MKSKKTIMSKKGAIVLIIILLVALVLICFKVYRQLYDSGNLQKKYSEVPEMYIKMKFNSDSYKGYEQIAKTKLISYNWEYNGETKNNNISLDESSFTKEETIYVFEKTEDHIWPYYELYTEPRYLMWNMMSATLKSDVSGIHANTPNTYNSGFSEIDKVYVSGSNSPRVEIWTINTDYINQGSAVYAVKVVYFGSDPIVIKDYIGKSLNDEQIKEMVSKLPYGYLLNSAKLEDDTLYLNYKYYLNNSNSSTLDTNTLEILSVLTNVNRVVYTADNKKTIYYDENTLQQYFLELEQYALSRNSLENKYKITPQDVVDYIERSAK